MGLILTAVCVVLLGFGALMGLLRHPRNSLVRLGTLLLSALIAFFAAKALTKKLGGMLVDVLMEQIASDGALSAYMQENATFAEGMTTVCQMMLAPIAFLLLYIVIKLIMLIPHAIICKILKKAVDKKKKRGCLSRLVGVPVGILCALVGVVVLITPICGYTEMVGELMEATATDGESGVQEEITEIADAPLAGELYDLVGEKLFRGLSTAKWDGDKLCLGDEVDTLVSLMTHFDAIGNTQGADYGDAQTQALSGIADDVSNSSLLSHLGSALLSDASVAWLEGREFLGTARPNMGESFDGLLNGFFEVFSTSDADNIGGDLDCFAKIFELLNKHELFALLGDSSNTEGFVTKLMSGGIIDEFYAVLDAHSRMLPVKNALADTGMRVFMQQLGTPDDLKQTHGELLNDMGASIKNVTDEEGNVNKEAFQTELTTVFAEHNVDLNEETTRLITDGFMNEFTPEELKTLSQEEIVDRMIERFTQAK